MQRILIAPALFAGVSYKIPVQASASDRDNDIDDLPVLHRHRVKPFAVAARENLADALSGKSRYRDQAGQALARQRISWICQRPHWAKEPLPPSTTSPCRHLGLESRYTLTTLGAPDITGVLSDSLKRDRERAQPGEPLASGITVDDHAVRWHFDRISTLGSRAARRKPLASCHW